MTAALQRRPRALERDRVELLLLAAQRGIDPRQLLLVQHVAFALLDRLDAAVVLRLELLERAHHRVIDVLRVARGNAGLGLGGTVVDIEVHWCAPGVEGVKTNSLSSRRTPGPITTGVCGYDRWCNGCERPQASEVMGPGVRWDDSCRVNASRLSPRHAARTCAPSVRASATPAARAATAARRRLRP